MKSRPSASPVYSVQRGVDQAKGSSERNEEITLSPTQSKQNKFRCKRKGDGAGLDLFGYPEAERSTLQGDWGFKGTASPWDV